MTRLSASARYSKYFVSMVFFLACLSTAFAVVTVTVNSPNGGENIRGNNTIDFNWTDSNEAASPYQADIYYSLTAGAYDNSIALSVDVTDANATDPDGNVATTNNYVFTWDTTIATDGNYFIDVIVSDGNSVQSNDSSDTSFNLDNTAPTTTSDADNNVWKIADISVTLTCTDANSGCQTTQYRLDTDSSSTVSYGNWTAYSGAVSVTTDGNYALDFNSTDNAGNTETTSTVYLLLDKTAPSTADDAPAGWQSSAVSVTLTCSDANSGCDTTQYRLDTNSSSTASYGNWTAYSGAVSVAVDGNYALDYNSTDNAGNTETTNTIYVLVDQTAPTVSISNTATTINGVSFVLNYTGSDTNGSIKKYWVSEGGTAYIDNGTNTSYTFTVTAPGGSTSLRSTFYVKSMDQGDQNSTAASITILFVYGGSTPVLPPQPSCGDDVCDEGENSSNCPADCPASEGDEPLEEGLDDEGVSDEGDASGGTEVTPGDSCKGISCNDNNPCTDDSCSQGSCVNSRMSDGTVCGLNKVCSQGKCIQQQPQATPGVAGKPAEMPSGLILPFTLLLVLIAAAYVYLYRPENIMKFLKRFK